MARPVLSVKGYQPEQIKALFRKDERYTIGIRLYAIYQVSLGQSSRKLEDLYNTSFKQITNWVHQFEREGIEGLKTRQKSGRPFEISKEASYQIKKELEESIQGWTTKQVEELIIKKSGIKYHYTHIYRILRKWGFKQKVPRKVHVNAASQEEKEAFKKRPNRYLWISSKSKSKSRSSRKVSL